MSRNKKGIKVLLVLANSMMDNFIPLGVSLLSACLKQAGHEVKLFDTTFYKTREEPSDDARVKTLQVAKTNLSDYGIDYKKTKADDDFRKMVLEYKPELIGFSVIEITYLIGLSLLNTIKDIDIPKVMGGIHVTFAPDEVIAEDAIDMICLGEGEDAIVELANRIARNHDFSDVENLWLKKDGKMIKNELRDLKNINKLPYQDWDIYEKKRFYKPMGGNVYVMGNVEIDRSCPYKCTYCANAGLHRIYRDKGIYYRQRDITIALKELSYLKNKYNLQYVYFIAENFLGMKKERFERFVELYRKIKLPFYIDTRPETITLENAKLIDELGCEGVAMGLEHGDESFRRKYLKRYISNETVIKAVDILRDNTNIRVSINNIIGFPFETRELIFKTIEVNRKIRAQYIMCSLFSPYRGTKLWEVCVENKLIPKNVLAGDYRSDYMLEQPQLSKERVLGLRRCFPLYVRFPKSKWPLIEKAEKFDAEGNQIFAELAEDYTKKFLRKAPVGG